MVNFSAARCKEWQTHRTRTNSGLVSIKKDETERRLPTIVLVLSIPIPIKLESLRLSFIISFLIVVNIVVTSPLSIGIICKIIIEKQLPPLKEVYYY